MSMEPEIQRLIDKFRAKVASDENVKKEIAHLDKTFNIDLGEESYSFHLKDSEISDFKPELLEEADVTLITTPESLQGLIDGTLRPMRAYVTKKIKIKGKIDDLMFLKKFFRSGSECTLHQGSEAVAIMEIAALSTCLRGVESYIALYGAIFHSNNRYI